MRITPVPSGRAGESSIKRVRRPFRAAVERTVLNTEPVSDLKRTGTGAIERIGTTLPLKHCDTAIPAPRIPATPIPWNMLAESNIMPLCPHSAAYPTQIASEGTVERTVMQRSLYDCFTPPPPEAQPPVMKYASIIDKANNLRISYKDKKIDIVFYVFPQKVSNFVCLIRVCKTLGT